MIQLLHNQTVFVMSKQVNDELEQRVAERTAKLESKTRQLQQMAKRRYGCLITAP